MFLITKIKAKIIAKIKIMLKNVKKI